MVLMNKLTLAGVIFILSSVLTSAQTKIIAHRGFSGVAPENTLIAFQKAIECGADYFELDVHKTKDGLAVVIHDKSVNRTSSNGVTGKIAEMDYSELGAINVGYSKKFDDKFKNEKIPTLREALELAKGKIEVCIEIKVEGVEEEVLKIVNELGVNDEVIIFSFSYSVLTKIRQLDSKIPILFLKSRADKVTIGNAKDIEASAIGVGSLTVITKEFIDYAHSQGIEVWRYTVDNKDKMKKLIDIGLDGLITNFPDRALKIRAVKQSLESTDYL